MGDEHSAVGGLGAGHLPQLCHDVFIGEPVETVSQHAFVPKTAGQGEALGDLGHVPMKGRVETGDLLHGRKQTPDRVDGLQLVRQMLGGEADDLFERLRTIRA